MYYEAAKRQVEIEYAVASEKWPEFNSSHEGYAVIKEELEELWSEIKANPQNKQRMALEAGQVAAMALRFLVDCC